MKIFQPLRNVKQLRCMKEVKLVFCWSHRDNCNLPYQGWSRCVGMRHDVLIDVPILPPVINEGKLKQSHVHAAEY